MEGERKSGKHILFLLLLLLSQTPHCSFNGTSSMEQVAGSNRRVLLWIRVLALTSYTLYINKVQYYRAQSLCAFLQMACTLCLQRLYVLCSYIHMPWSLSRVQILPPEWDRRIYLILLFDVILLSENYLVRQFSLHWTCTMHVCGR